MIEGVENVRHLAVDGILEKSRIGQHAARSQLLEAIAHAVLTRVTSAQGYTRFVVPNDATAGHE
jgi:Flp pilus assembly protein CpaB